MAKQKVYSPLAQMSLEQVHIQRVLKSLAIHSKIPIEDVRNVSQDPNYFEDDIDCFIGDSSYEIKLDFYKSGFCFLETISNNKTGALGWLLISKADWLVYAFPDENVFYLASMRVVREWLLDNVPHLKDNRRNVKNQSEDNSTYMTFGYVVSRDGLEELGIFKRFVLHK